MDLQTNPTFGEIRRTNLRLGIAVPPIQVLTTTPEVVLETGASGSPRKLTEAASITNNDDQIDVLVTFYYTDQTNPTFNTSDVLSILRIPPLTTIPIGQYLLVSGFSLQAKADVGGVAGVFLAYEEAI